ncbi:MAG TPA: DUF6600 domain-containing protein [Beijerinckiaceae bacterium]|nr:DUF6600 domain-containing protein [Beijerinckiaceae bacterium]
MSSAIVFGLAVSSFGGIAVAMPNPGAQQQQAVTLDQQKAILSQYGQFTTLPQYGEVWVPSGLPQGWHPYPPCNWVFEKTLGWYYDDKTAWGAIVHHYGRWTSDPQLGWVWVPGKEFSPGWVVWRASPDWDGWAPLPPDADLQTISAQSFDTDKDWIFVTAKDFGKCGTQVQATPQIFRDTQVVREVRYVGGIFVPIFPTYIVAPIVVDLNIGWFPWGPGFIGGIFNVWNFIWNNIEINVVVNVCHPNNIQPMQKPITPINSNPPPAPGGGPKLPPITIPPKLPPRVDNNPPLLPPVVSNPPTRVFNPPPVVIDTPPPRVVKIDPPPVIKPPVIDRCFGWRCRPPVLGGPVKPIDGGIGAVVPGPKPGRTPPTFGRGNGPVFTNIGRQADVGGGAIRPGPVFTGRSVANPVLAHSGPGFGGGAPMHPAMGFGRFR